MNRHWVAFWRFIFGHDTGLTATWSDGFRGPVGFFASWRLNRSPHLLVRLESNGKTIWERN